MKNILSLVKSSLHDLRCCDENSGVIGYRALTSSITCVLNGSGDKTGYAHVATLEQFTIATSAPTGVTVPNVPTQTGYIPDYIDNNMCSVVNVGGNLCTVYNGNLFEMTVALTDLANPAINYIFNVPALTGQTFNVANANYSVDLTVLNNDGSNVSFDCNEVSDVIPSGLPFRITPVSTPINVGSAHSDQPLTQ